MISSYTISNDSDEIGVLGTTRQQEKQHKEEKEEDAVLMKAFDWISSSEKDILTSDTNDYLANIRRFQKFRKHYLMTWTFQ